MKPSEISRFFRELSRRIKFRARITLVGGAAAVLQGGARPTQDIDFQMEAPGAAAKKRRTFLQELSRAIQDVSRVTGIVAQFSEDAQRWSMIATPGGRIPGRRFAKFGKVELCLAEPGYWAVGKLGRYLETDRLDLVRVLRRQKPPAQKTVRLWGRALGLSPASTEQWLFRAHVEHFLKNHGMEIWGARFNPESAIADFMKLARTRR